MSVRMPMKIIFCKGQLQGPVSGADETLVSYATHLSRAGHDVSVLLMYPHSRDDPYYDRLCAIGVPVSTLAADAARDSLEAGRRLGQRLVRTLPAAGRLVRSNAHKASTVLARRYYGRARDHMRRSGADITHVLTPDPAAMVMIRAASAAGVPVLYQELGIPYDPPDYRSFYKHFTSVLPLCAEVAALSPLLARSCRERLPRATAISVLPILTDDLRNGHAAARPPGKWVTFGFAARIEHLKGPMILLEAFAAACERRRDLRLKIAGSGSLERKLAARAKALGVTARCQFVGVYTTHEERLAFMQGLDVFALPSLTEGTPNSIVEAMSHGLPVIATTVGGVPDLVTPEVGLLVPPNDAPALADGLLLLAEDAELRARMSRAAKRRYTELFLPEVILPVLLDTYHRVAATVGARRTQSLHHSFRHPWADPAEHAV
jgi:glycosyltransferase involved in cell wall biosynthesis